MSRSKKTRDGGTRAPGCRQRLEQAPLLVAGDAAPLVAHAQHDVALDAAQRDVEASPGRHRLEPVPGQVPEYLRDLVRLGEADVGALVRLEGHDVVGPDLA